MIEGKGEVKSIEAIKKLLSSHLFKTITLTHPEQLFKPYIHTYEEFPNRILSLEKEEVLAMLK
ncbi:hypothetical protein KP78_16560 [Jeotgalibacillus soli]|uniref:Uncharacterized protein n=2 Tax=Jeotgalibacillus soli TaxID=889306 RepID=A0A0C2S2G7_9BACL|nr:hypothetical protein KP78_16560 [Jeotgalibacillus soli]